MAITLDGTNGILSPDFEPSSSTTPTNGLFLPAANTVGLATGSTERLRIDSSGNLGLGVTPSAWGTAYRTALQVGSAACFAGVSGVGASDYFAVGGNFYLDSGAGYKYIRSTTANRLEASAGEFRWYTAPSGTAGNAISFTQAMTLDASGNLGIGTTSPSSFGKFVVADNTAFAWNIGTNNTASATVGVPAAGVPTSFAVNLPTHSTYYPASFYITGSYNGSTSVTTAELHAVGVKYSAWSSNIAFFTSSGTTEYERARIDSSGNLLVGMTSPGFSQNGFNANISQGANIWGVGVGGNSTSPSLTGYSLYSTSGSAYKFYVQYSGSIYATSTTITAISDQRLKENIRDLDDGLSTILALKPRKFDWKEGKGKDIKDDRGFIAQEFEQVFPDLIDTWKDPAPEGEEPYKSVRPDLIPVMVKAIQELTARLEALEAK